MQHPSATRSRNTGVLALAAIAPIWGYSWVVSKVALGYSGPFTLVALITVLCVAVLMPVLALTRRSLRPPPVGWTVAIAVLQTALFNALVTLALTMGGAGKVSVLAYTMPFWLLLLAWPLLRERLRGFQWPAVALAFAGLVLVVQPWRIGGALPGVLAAAAGLCWAGGSLLTKLLQQRADVEPLSLTAWQMAFGAVALIAAAVVTGDGWPQWTAAFIGCLVYSVVLSNALCWALWVFALDRLPAGAAGLGTLAVPVLGVVAAWLQLGEAPAAAEGAGMLLIVAALALLAIAGLRAGRAGDGEPLPPVVD
ncbi:MAG TPA: DMT family transporter [Thermoleophilia bacterium]|nr:DMT family transporter [Thermoleophilia bacterium]